MPTAPDPPSLVLAIGSSTRGAGRGVYLGVGLEMGMGGKAGAQGRGRDRRRRGCRARARSTSGAGCSRCHWATGRRGWASMSAQCCSCWPEARAPSHTLPTGSVRKCRPRAQTASTRSTFWVEPAQGPRRSKREKEGAEIQVGLGGPCPVWPAPCFVPTWTRLKGTAKVKASLKYGAAVPFLAEVLAFIHFLCSRTSCTFTKLSGRATGPRVCRPSTEPTPTLSVPVAGGERR